MKINLQDMEHFPARKNIFLVGFMGSGKSTIGPVIAGKLHKTFLETDRLVESLAGIPVPEIFAIHGETWFRALEQKILFQLQLVENCVIATGGGLPCFHHNMEKMNQSGITIYLETTPTLLFERLKTGRDTRPLLKNLPETALMSYILEKLAEREPFYKTAHYTFSAGETPFT